MLTSNSDVISAYKNLNSITLTKVSNLLKSKFNISDKVANTMIALSALEAGGYYKNRYTDYLWDYYGAIAQINYTLNHSGSMYDMYAGSTPLLCPSYYSSGIMEFAWNNALGQDNLKFVYIAAEYYTPYIISFCGADDDASDAGGSYGFTTSYPHLLNSDGGDARFNSSNQNIYTWITSNAKITSTSLLYTSEHAIVQSYIDKIVKTHSDETSISKKNGYILKAFKPVFNSTYFYNKYSTKLKKYKGQTHQLLQYFLNKGIANNMQGCSTFDPVYYENKHKTLYQKFGKDYSRYYIHYLKTEDKPKAYLFKDVPSDYKESSKNPYFKAIEYVTNKDIMSGNDNGYFKPEKELSRSEVAVILWKLFGKPQPTITFGPTTKTITSEVVPDTNEDIETTILGSSIETEEGVTSTLTQTIETGNCPYTDCSNLTLAKKKAILWLYEQKIWTGYSNNTFRPSNKVPKRTLAILFYRLKGSPKVSGSLTSYNDIGEAKGTEAYNAILWCINKKILIGNTTTKKWVPKHKIQKEDLAVGIYKYLTNE